MAATDPARPRRVLQTQPATLGRPDVGRGSRHELGGLIITGTRDLFLSNCVRTYWKLRDLAGTVELRIWEDMRHAFFGEPDLPETVRCFNEVATFCRD